MERDPELANYFRSQFGQPVQGELAEAEYTPVTGWFWLRVLLADILTLALAFGFVMGLTVLVGGSVLLGAVIAAGLTLLYRAATRNAEK